MLLLQKLWKLLTKEFFFATIVKIKEQAKLRLDGLVVQWSYQKVTFALALHAKELEDALFANLVNYQ